MVEGGSARSSASRARVGVAVLVLLAASCGEEARTSSHRSSPEEPGGRVAVPSPFFDAGTNVLAATRGHLVGFTMARSSDGAAPRAAGHVVDLSSGRAGAAAPPSFEGEPFNPIAATADDRTVLLAGQTCPSLEDDGACRGSRPASFTYDPGSDRWTPHAIPTRAGSPPRDWSIVLLATRADGSFVGLFREGRGDLRHRLMTFHVDDGWVEVSGDVRVDGSILSTCATASHLFVLQRPPVQEVDGSDPPSVGLTLAAIDLDGGQRAEVGLPPVSTATGVAGVQFGCGPDGPVVSAPPPEARSAEEAKGTRAHRWHDGRWVELVDLFDDPDVTVTRAVGGPRGVVLSGRAPATGGRVPARHAVAVDRNGGVRTLPVDLGLGGTALWRGLSGELLLLDEATGTELVAVEVLP